MKLTALIAAALLLLSTGCTPKVVTPTELTVLEGRSELALQKMQQRDPTLQQLLEKSYGWIVFPEVNKGGLVAGATFGRGTAYVREHGVVGYVELRQATVGGQIGGQTYSELVVLQNQAALDRLREGKLTFETDVSAIALDRTDGQNAQYKEGYIVFIHREGGLMASAVIGGQQFTFIRKD